MSKKTNRKYARINFSQMAEFIFENKPPKNYPIDNISLSGLYIPNKLNLRRGRNCIITVNNTFGGQEFRAELAAKIARNCKNGTALQFTTMTQPAFEFLQTILLYNCVDPISMGEEFAKSYPCNVIDYLCPVSFLDKKSASIGATRLSL